MPRAKTHPVEEWRPVVGYEGRYEVSNLGRVRRLAYILQGSTNANGYISVYLPNDGIKYGGSLGRDRHGRRGLIHRIVATAFLGPIPIKKEVNHKDGNPGNNKANNLEIATRLENIRHAYNTGLAPNRTGRLNGKLTIEEKMAVRREFAAGGVSKRELGRKYNVTGGAIAYVVSKEGGFKQCLVRERT